MSAGAGTVPFRPVKPDGLDWLGIFACLVSVLLLYAGALLAMHSGTSSEGPEASGLVILLLLGYVLLILSSAGPFILATVYLVAAIGLFLGRRWAWHLSLALSILSIALNLGQVAFFGLAGLFDLLILFFSLPIPYYLTRPRIKHFFDSATR